MFLLLPFGIIVIVAALIIIFKAIKIVPSMKQPLQLCQKTDL